MPRSNWLPPFWQTRPSLPPSFFLPKLYLCMCVCMRELADWREPQRQPLTPTQWAHSLHTHTQNLSSALCPHSLFNPGTQEEEGGESTERERKRQWVAERESEGEGVREERGRERQRETGGVWGRTPWLQIRGWLRCCYGLYHYRLWAPREVTAMKVRKRERVFVCVCVNLNRQN